MSEQRFEDPNPNPLLRILTNNLILFEAKIPTPLPLGNNVIIGDTVSQLRWVCPLTADVFGKDTPPRHLPLPPMSNIPHFPMIPTKPFWFKSPSLTNNPFSFHIATLHTTPFDDT